MMKKGLLLVLAIFAAIALVGCGKTAEKEETFKVALAIPGSKTDGGWSQVAYQGLVQIEEKLGAEVSLNENTQPADYVRVLRDYAKAGNNLVIGHGFEFGDPALEVAKEFPDVMFIVTSTNITNNTNVGSINNNYLQAGFLQGAFAALMSKTGTVANVGGLNIPPIVNNAKGFEAGAKYINPNIKVLSTIIGSGDDVNKAKEQALTFIAQGADIIMANANAAGRGVYVAATEKGIWSIASIAAEYDAYDKTLIACSKADMATAIFVAAKQVKEGTYKAGFELMGVAQGIVGFNYSPKLDSNVPADIKTKLADLEKKLGTNEIDVTKLVQ